jgi:hypothetical protein
VRKSSFAIALLASLVAGSCRAAQTAEPFTVRQEGRTLFFAGELKGDAAAALYRSLVQPATALDTLVINSPGGEGDQVLPIASAVARAKLKVVVRGMCISACTQIFIAGAAKEIEPHSIVSFHSSATSMAEYLKASGLPRGGEVFARVEEAERRFYLSLGVDPRLPLVTAAMMKPLCIVEDPSRAVADAGRYGIGWQHSTVILNHNQLERLGVRNVSGYWPTASALRDDLRGLGFRDAFQPEYDAAASEPPANVAAKPLPRCGAAVGRAPA